MNENIDLNVTNPEQSFLEEEIAEPNGSETNDNAPNEPKNSPVQKRKPLLVADGTGHPPGVDEEISPEVIV
ncbi:hypothetical protein H6G93_12355 [Nostoc sp. FACHB-973]|nr:hypothetical protein [Nostoc sp. FACHB-973]